MSTASILDWWQITPQQLTELVDDNPSLRGMILGYLSEMKLREIFASDKRVTSLHKDDDHDRQKKGDLVAVYRDHTFTIESKALQTNSIKKMPDGTFTGKVQCDASDRRTITLPDGQSVTTTCLKFGEFDILATSLFAFRGEWVFGFIRNSDLPTSTYKKYPDAIKRQLIKTLVSVSLPIERPFYDNPFDLMDEMIEEKQHS